MAFSSDPTPSFRYLGDGDGFPVNIRRNFWEGLGSSNAYMNTNNVFTVEAQTVGTDAYNDQISDGNDNFPSGWNNFAGSGAVVGKTNFLLLNFQQAMEVFWKLRGIKYEVPTMSASIGSANAFVSVPQEIDFTEVVGYNSQPFNRIWALAEGGTQFREFHNVETVFDREYRSGRLIEYTQGATANINVTLRVPYGKLVRYPFGAGGFGFEPFAEIIAGRSIGRNSKDHWNGGSASSSTQVMLGTQFDLPEDKDDGNGNTVTNRIERVNFGGVRLLQYTRQTTNNSLALAGSTEGQPINVNFDDVILWNNFV
jgi:hypothetical protein